MGVQTVNPLTLLAAAQHVQANYPEATLKKNGVGNLSIMQGNEFVAWIDLVDGKVHRLWPDGFTDIDWEDIYEE